MPWLWVVLLPFIDETRLFTVMNELSDSFTEEEKERNSFGPSLLFVHEVHPLFDQTKVLSCTDEGEWVPANGNGGWSGTILKLKPENCHGIAAVGEELVAPTIPKGELRCVAVSAQMISAHVVKCGVLLLKNLFTFFSCRPIKLLVLPINYHQRCRMRVSCFQE